MSIKHLNDQMIQEYVWDKSALQADEVLHIETCARCSAVAEDYKTLFMAVEAVPKPSFGFDLAAAVLTQIEPIRSTSLDNRPQTNTWFSWSSFAAIFIVVLLVAMPVYFFRDDISEIVFNASSTITWLIVMMVALIALFLGIDEYRKYSHRLNKLDTQ